MNEDITFCTNRKCGVTKCERNPKNIRHWYMPHSFAELENTIYCPKQERKKQGKKGSAKHE